MEICQPYYLTKFFAMKDQLILKAIVVLLLSIGSQVGTAANYPPKAEKWDFLGEHNIGHHLDRDVITVRNDRVLYREIEIRTDRSNIDLHRCVIYFRDGGRQRVEFRRDRRGGEAHIIDLKGGARAIDKIAVWGSRDHNQIFKIFDKGRVEIWGKVAKRRRDRDRNRYRDNDYYRSRKSTYDRDYRGRDNRREEWDDRRDSRRDDQRRNNRSMCPPRRN